MKPKEVQQINDFLAVVWEDSHESIYPFEYLRRHCPCAGCQGETVGNIHYTPPPTTYRAESFQLVSIEPVGGYALRPVWGDGHGTGLFSFDFLRQLCPCDLCADKKPTVA